MKDYWNDLSMSDRNEYIKIAVRNGIVAPEEIKKLYNEFAEGGRKPLFNKEKVLSRVYGDTYGRIIPFPITDAVKQYFKNSDTAVDDRIKYLENLRNALPENVEEGKEILVHQFENGEINLDELENGMAAYALERIKQHEDAKRIYLGYEPKYGTMEPSPYQPTIGKSNNPYLINPLLSDEGFEDVIFPLYNQWKSGNITDTIKTKKTSKGFSREPRVINYGRTALIRDIPYLNNATLSEGFDNKGQYISLFDTWDYNTKYAGKSGDNIGKLIGGEPFDIYQRYYLDDWLDVPEDKHGSYYLPEVTVTPNNYADGNYLDTIDGGILPEVDITPTIRKEARRKDRLEKKNARVAARLNTTIGKIAHAVNQFLKTPIQVSATYPSTGWNGTLFYLSVPKVDSTIGAEIGTSLAGISPILGKAAILTTPYFLTEGTANAVDEGLSVGNGLEIGLSALGIPSATKYATNNIIFPTMGKMGNNWARGRVIGNAIEGGILNASKNGRIIVNENYFHSPDSWFRKTETPEIFGIREVGKNVTSRDAAGIVPSFDYKISRQAIEEANQKLINPNAIYLGKSGSAHGNRSQGSWGKLWEGSTARSSLFDEAVLEGKANMIDAAYDAERGVNLSRSNFRNLPSFKLPIGTRVGFKTGEMPLDNLRWFRKNPNGTYNYEGFVIPNKTVEYTPTTQSLSRNTYYLPTSKSTISEAERLGVPKGERNARLSKPDYDTMWDKDTREYFMKESQPIPKDSRIFYDEALAEKYKSENPEYFENYIYSTKKSINRAKDKFPDYFGTAKTPDDLKKYIESLPDDINPNFLRDDGIQSFYILDYRKYLQDIGYTGEHLSDNDIAKLLTDLYNKLTKTLTGLAKGKLLFHSTRVPNELFDYRTFLGTGTGNIGYSGPANYFSRLPTYYGFKQNKINYAMEGSRQPYLITDIKSIPLSSHLRTKGVIPPYISPEAVPAAEYKSVIENALTKTKNSNMLILDNTSVYPQALLDGKQIEFGLPRNTGIKSLYPHPESVTFDKNGLPQIIRNWDDIRVNYATGGRTHTVSKGDVAGKIAESYGIGLSLLLLANPDINLSKIKIGLELIIPRKTDGPLDFDELRMRQGWAESRFKSKTTSPVGARGIYLIMPSTLADYNTANNTKYDKDDLFKDDINTKIRDWSMEEDLYNASFIDKPESSDSIRYAKALASYNWGRGNALKSLNDSKSKGIDIYDSWDWLKVMPQETLNYVNFILRNQDTGGNRVNALYLNYKNLLPKKFKSK